MVDYFIKDAFIVDGTGAPGFRSSLSVKDGKIVSLGEAQSQAKETINAEGLVVSPGFIDITNHSDTYWTLFSIPGQDSMVMQGVTTLMGGNCGSSLAPLASGEAIRALQKWTPLGEVALNWRTVKEFLAAVEDRGLGVNFGTFVGHSTLRRGVVGDEMRPLETEELDKMVFLLEESLKDGAFGMSTGLVYAHGKYTSIDELVTLGQVLARYQCLYTTHLRSEGRHLLSAVDEVIHISEESGVAAHISHFKAIGKRNWPLFSQALTLLNRALKRGLDLTFDIYPYRSTGSVLYLLLPDWVLKGGKDKILSRIKNPELRVRIIKQMAEHPIPYERIFVADAWRRGEEVALGKSIEALAKSVRKIPQEIVLDLLISHDLRVVTLQVGEIGLDNLKKALKHPKSLFASDGAGYDLSFQDQNVIVHPRSFGAFPRVLGQFVRRLKLISLETAVARMTGQIAQLLKLSHRGKIDRGFFADLVLFDAERILDESQYFSPYKYSTGIEYVFVNGRMVVKEGKLIGGQVGHILRSMGKSTRAKKVHDKENLS